MERQEIKKKNRIYKKKIEKIDYTEIKRVIPVVSINNTLDGIIPYRTEEFWKNIYENEILFSGIFNSHLGLSNIIYEAFKGRVYMSGPNYGYVYDGVKRLWEKKPLSYMNTMTTEFLSFYIRNQISRKHENNVYEKLSKTFNCVLKIDYGERVFKLVSPKLLNYDFHSKLNSSPNELPIKDGIIINLKTLETRIRTENDLFDFEVNCRFIKNNDIPNANKFFMSLMCNDIEITNYLQYILGYSMTGETDLRSIFILWGKGSNGKSVTFELLKSILHKLCITVDKKIFIKNDKQNTGHTAHLMPLVGARMAIYSETEENDELNSSTIKSLTGNDTISVRPIYGEQTDIKPFCKYLLLTNHKPTFNIRDQALIDRIKYIPFNARFIDNPKLQNEFIRDNQFIEDLKTKYLDEVFTWLCIGANKYYNNRIINIPLQLKNETDKYLNELDSVTRFIKENIAESKESIKKTLLYEKYVTFCNENEIKKMVNKSSFYDTLDDKGYEMKKRDGYYYYINISFIK